MNLRNWETVFERALAASDRARGLLGAAHCHRCAHHRLFSHLAEASLTTLQAAALLRNYDAHASLLRRLLLKAATIMPEPAVGYVLENVRNEYGNGDFSNNHQRQLRQVVEAMGVSADKYRQLPIMPGTARFIRAVGKYYCPPASQNRGTRQTRSPFSKRSQVPNADPPLQAGAKSGQGGRIIKQLAASSNRALPGVDTPPAEYTVSRAAVAAGAITATEVLSIEEFRALHQAFSRIGQGHHIWFNHVTVEQEHTDDSLQLALFFVDKHSAFDDVMRGMNGVLDANVQLYDGLYQAATLGADAKY